MLRKLLITLTLIIIITIQKLSASEINIKVNGLVCEFCAITLEKNFKKSPQIEKIEINLEQKNIKLNVSNNKDISNQEITEIIINNGYAVAEIIRINNVEE